MLNYLLELFNVADVALSDFASLPLRVIIYGMVAGLLTMLIYRRTSDQHGIKRLKQELKEVRSAMMAVDPDNSKEFFRLSKLNLSLAFRFLGKVIVPVFASGLIVILIAVWLEIQFGHAIPPAGSTIKVTAVPEATVSTALPATDGNSGKIPATCLIDCILYADGKQVYQGSLAAPPMAVVTKRLWWSGLLENPAGYLDENAPVDSLHFDFQPRRLFVNDSLPDWMLGWEFTFFLSLFLVALLLKFVLRIH